MADENEFGAATEINEDEMGEELHVVSDDEEEVTEDDDSSDLLSDDEEDGEFKDEEEDPFKVGLEEILDPNRDEDGRDW